ncbi:FAD-binding oxidoreductase [Gammaproteobacteria bacterium 53_120_T64]|nr:FAD-binding oxidoreductase [Gammaproteobacteria bacterium 53_120_T64]
MNPIIADSPFHRGEQILQQRLGVREKMERFGRQVIHDQLPAQHRDFYRQLPFVFVGHADSQDWPWASILFNKPGFMTSDAASTLRLNASPVAGDPLAAAWHTGTRLGLLGIELATRRRNRLAAHIHEVSPDGIELAVDQAFGNCPQYIQSRELVALDKQAMPAPEVSALSEISADIREWIESSDTFFVASYKAVDSGQRSDGADVSHRGGKPGFIRVDGNSLVIPDYLGNNHFNTLGNFHETPKAGLLFVDFERGQLLTLTGRVEVLWDAEEAQHFTGAQRLWKFHLDHGFYQKNVLPLRWQQPAASPNTLLTGTWAEAQALEQAEQQREQWLPYKVLRVVDESPDIRSIYLQAQGHQQPSFKPGQFLTLRVMVAGKPVIRTYTLSSAPADDVYRISVKRQPGRAGQPEGLLSNYLHRQLCVGEILEAKSPRGDFSFDAAELRPAVLLSAGIGITPMLSMAKHVLHEGMHEGTRTRRMRQLTVISTARDQQQRGFFAELDAIAAQSNQHIRTYWALTQPNKEAQPGRDFHHRGRISAAFLQAVLALADYDFYLCGPSDFMQTLYDLLRTLGVNDGRIFAEAFGPASLVRECDTTKPVFKPQAAATDALVSFVDTQVQQAWSVGDGSLLTFAEAHGLNPEFGCRSGQCGACKVALVSGRVSYQNEPSVALADDEVLLCCAVPAAIEGEAVVKLALQL